MESIDLAQQIGTALGAAAATAGAVWGALVRPMQRQLAQASAQDPEIPFLLQRMAALERRLEKTEERATRSVTDEEFETYTRTLNKNVQSLTEKIGSATGAIEAWYRFQNHGR